MEGQLSPGKGNKAVHNSVALKLISTPHLFPAQALKEGQELEQLLVLLVVIPIEMCGMRKYEWESSKDVDVCLSTHVLGQ